MEIQAENLNPAEIKAAVSRDEGGNPRPIRKRGWHRALKRKESWAIGEDIMRKAIQHLCCLLYASHGPLKMRGFAAWLPK